MEKSETGYKKSQASCDRNGPLCRQRHLSGYRSRTRTLTLTITRTLKIKENKNDTGLCQHRVIFITYFPKGRGWVYQRPISEIGSFFLIGPLRSQVVFQKVGEDIAWVGGGELRTLKVILCLNAITSSRWPSRWLVSCREMRSR